MHTNAVILRALQASDANELAILLNNKNIWDHVRDYLPYPYTLLDAVKFIEMQKDNQNDLIYAIQADGILAGCISLSSKSDVYKLNGEIGFWLGECFWGKGIATEAVKQIIKKGFLEINLHRIYASVFSFNIASVKVLEKAGFIKEAVLKEAVVKNNCIADEYIYALLNKNCNYD